MLENWLFPQLETDADDFIFPQVGAPPHWSLDIREFLNNRIPQRWIGRTGHPWPPRSPMRFLLVEVSERLRLRAYPSSYISRTEDTHNSNRGSSGLLAKVWDEFDYRIDICRESKVEILSNFQSVYKKTL
ncbi:hypothetical protein AVEN_212115-1 [Araneus ventricosus]|uniref:Uncharacterized protein n=1 Tax=Araneus ventricosus TaxID=182803 RepID=A0A4Y2TVT4_ARAVE|nr:hypothetical protein AVEN_212115-1 [Araneus ventricosus]